MPWGKLDDSLYDNPKLDKLGQHRMAAVGLWAVSISWCNRWLTDGRITIERIRALGGTTRQAEALVIAGLFDRDGEGYRVHDFLAFNDSREEVLARRAAAAHRQRKSRGQSHGESQVQSQRDIARSHSTPPRALPDQTRPDPNPGPATSAPVTDDPADAYWSLTGRYPTDKPLAWIDDLSSKYGPSATVRALAKAHISDSKTATLLGRAQDILRAEARSLDRAEQEAEKERLREKRAIPKVIPAWEQEFRAALEAKYGAAS